MAGLIKPNTDGRTESQMLRTAIMAALTTGGGSLAHLVWEYARFTRCTFVRCLFPPPRSLRTNASIPVRLICL